MKGIIKLHAKISGIAPIDQNAVNVKLSVSKCEQRVNETKPYKLFDYPKNTLLTNKEITLNYQGPVRLSHKEDEEFAFSTPEANNMYGAGANISDLFVGDKVEVYIRWETITDASDNMHLVIKNTIIVSAMNQPEDISQLLPKLVLAND